MVHALWVGKGTSRQERQCEKAGMAEEPRGQKAASSEPEQPRVIMILPTGCFGERRAGEEMVPFGDCLREDGEDQSQGDLFAC